MIKRNVPHHQHRVATALQSFIRLAGHPVLALGETVVLLVAVLFSLNLVFACIPSMPHEVHGFAYVLEVTAFCLRCQLKRCNRSS